MGYTNLNRGDITEMTVETITETEISGCMYETRLGDGKEFEIITYRSGYKVIFDLNDKENKGLDPKEIKVGDKIIGRVLVIYNGIIKLSYPEYEIALTQKNETFRWNTSDNIRLALIVDKDMIHNKIMNYKTKIPGYITFVEQIHKYLFISKDSILIAKNDDRLLRDIIGVKDADELLQYYASWNIAKSCNAFDNFGAHIKYTKTVVTEEIKLSRTYNIKTEIRYVDYKVLKKYFPVEYVEVIYNEIDHNYKVINNESYCIEEQDFIEIGCEGNLVKIADQNNKFILHNPFIKEESTIYFIQQNYGLSRNGVSAPAATIYSQNGDGFLVKYDIINTRDHISRKDIHIQDFYDANLSIKENKEQKAAQARWNNKMLRENNKMTYAQLEAQYGYDDDAIKSSPEYWDMIYAKSEHF